MAAMSWQHSKEFSSLCIKNNLNIVTGASNSHLEFVSVVIEERKMVFSVPFITLPAILPRPKSVLNFKFFRLVQIKSWYDALSEIRKKLSQSPDQEVLQIQELHAYWFAFAKVGERETVVPLWYTAGSETISVS